MSKVWWLVVVALSAPGAATWAASAAPAGWETDPAYVEDESIAASEGFHRRFVLPGDDPERWSERVEVRVVAEPGALPAGSLLDRMAGEERARCPDLTDSRIELPASVSDVTAVSLWHCPKNAATGYGEVKSIKLVRDAAQAVVMVAEGRYPPYEKGQTPLLRVQLDRWVDMQKSFELCREYTHPGCLPEAAVLDAAPAVEGDPTERAEIARLESLAMQIYAQDMLAWRATDFVTGRGLLDPAAPGHFLAMSDADGGGSVYFVPDRGRRRPRGLRIDIDSAGVESIGALEEALTGDAADRYRALRAALSDAELKLCSRTPNTVVVPDGPDAGWTVYVLSASDQPGLVFIGGHNRIKVSPRAKVLSTEHSARSCLAFDTQARPGDPGSGFYLATHLVSEMPWETHVFQSLHLDLPLIVPTRHAIWKVESGRLHRMAIEQAPRVSGAGSSSVPPGGG